MFVFLIVLIFSVFFAYCDSIADKVSERNDSSYNKSTGLKLAFFVIFIFCALRLDYGNDYPSYISAFNKINSGFDSYELGWVWLNRICNIGGFRLLIVITSFINCYAFYSFIKNNLTPNFYWLGVFIYLSNPDLMLLNLSMMRQALALSIFIYVCRFIREKRLLFFIIGIVIASLFHTSAILLLPVYFVNRIDSNKTKLSVFLYLGITFLLFIYANLFIELLSDYIFKYFLFYTKYFEFRDMKIGFGVILKIFFSVFFIYIMTKSKVKDTRIILLIASISSLFIPMSSVSSLFMRLGVYLLAFNVLAFPISMMQIKSKITKYAYVFIIIFFHLVMLIYFFKSETYGDAYYYYRSII